ncbi:response regulator [Candidatus Sumerlaeota bacterium]|nr:response regulator [Candidatus Sumerlaeota bacterium]
MSQHSEKPAIILLVEDDPGDQELTRRALEEGKIRNELYIVEDGEEAMDYLYHREKFANPVTSPRPDLILLDLNLPKLNGKQVLEKIRQDPELRRLAVVVLTTSRHEEDVLRTYDLGVNSYINKPVDLEQLTKLIHALEAYWFQVVVLPPS